MQGCRMSANVPLAHFDRSKPFYPLVMQYCIQLVGFKELTVRYVAGTSTLQEAICRVTRLSPEQSTDAAGLAANLKKLLGPLELCSSFRAEPLKVPVDDIAQEVGSNAVFLGSHLMLSAGSVLVLAHEMCKHKSAHNTGPLWEFLRHCRNAAGHGGKFNFLHGEPRRPANWGAVEIVSGLQGSQLFKGADGQGLLGPADPIFLLWDIEQTYPGLA